MKTLIPFARMFIWLSIIALLPQGCGLSDAKKSDDKPDSNTKTIEQITDPSTTPEDSLNTCQTSASFSPKGAVTVGTINYSEDYDFTENLPEIKRALADVLATMPRTITNTFWHTKGEITIDPYLLRKKDGSKGICLSLKGEGLLLEDGTDLTSMTANKDLNFCIKPPVGETTGPHIIINPFIADASEGEANTATGIRHGLVKAFGQVMSLMWIRSKFETPTDEDWKVSPLEKPNATQMAFLDKLDAAYNTDVLTANPDKPLTAVENLRAGSEEDKLLFKMILLSEVFDSYYCSDATRNHLASLKTINPLMTEKEQKGGFHESILDFFSFAEQNIEIQQEAETGLTLTEGLNLNIQICGPLQPDIVNETFKEECEGEEELETVPARTSTGRTVNCTVYVSHPICGYTEVVFRPTVTYVETGYSYEKGTVAYAKGSTVITSPGQNGVNQNDCYDVSQNGKGIGQNGTIVSCESSDAGASGGISGSVKDPKKETQKEEKKETSSGGVEEEDKKQESSGGSKKKKKGGICGSLGEDFRAEQWPMLIVLLFPLTLGFSFRRKKHLS